ncbi:MAG: GTPase ObgE [Alphaproteobacteria bacterium]|nr:GTPase ObgE [Alphaproteobacteria bacterium]
MNFVDETKIYVKSGAGGEGCVSFRREKFIPEGGPDGGDGGRGASIIMRAVTGLNTLIDYRFQQHFKGKKGGHGMGKQRYGKSAEDMYLEVPVGTQIYDEDRETLLADLTEAGQEIVLAKGGRGGLGNIHFKSSTNQAPTQSVPAGAGEERTLWLKLKLLSDAGLLGLPNAGKSTFLAAVSAATPKIADYPFTTLAPQLGVVRVGDAEFVLADIPGLIEGAAAGKGLGLKFLGHVERCGVLLHLVDGTADDVVAAYETVRHEIGQYDDELAEKPEIVALNKCDALTKAAITKKKKALEKASGGKVFTISAAARTELEPLLVTMLQTIGDYRGEQAPPPLPAFISGGSGDDA